MKKILTLVVFMSLVLSACGDKVTVNKYEGKESRSVETGGGIEDENNDIEDENSRQRDEEENSEAYQEAQPYEENETDQDVESNNTEISDTYENIEESAQEKEEMPEENDSVDEEYIPNGAISDRNMSMGTAYIGRKLTLEEVVELFSDLSNYENNELTSEVANKTMEYLNTTSEYDMINLWDTYSDLTKEERYAMIILTKYKQNFGGYSSSSMNSALKGNETYNADLNSIKNDLR